MNSIQETRTSRSRKAKANANKKLKEEEATKSPGSLSDDEIDPSPEIRLFESQKVVKHVSKTKQKKPQDQKQPPRQSKLSKPTTHSPARSPDKPKKSSPVRSLSNSPKSMNEHHAENQRSKSESRQENRIFKSRQQKQNQKVGYES